MSYFYKPFGVLTALLVAGLSQATIVHHYDDLEEGFLGETYSANGITYRDLNKVSGFYADGEAFALGDLDPTYVVENAEYFYNDFPGYGSANNSLTFGGVYVNGPNLSIGVLASAWIDFEVDAKSVSFDIAFYENGPWGGVSFVLEGYKDGVVVASTSYELADGGDRDNANFTTLSLTADAIDSLHLYGWKDGAYSAPRAMIDDLTVESVPEPATMAILGLGALAALKRRKRNS